MHNSNEIDENSNICSSSAIREVLNTHDLNKIQNYVPNNVYDILLSEYQDGYIGINLKNFEKEILYKLRTLDEEDIANIFDVTDGLEKNIKNAINISYDIESLISNIKSKRFTHTRICRILIHILLDIKKDFALKYKDNPMYIRVLAMNKNGEKILSSISKNTTLPIVTNVNKFLKIANDEQKELLKLDVLATNVYSLGYNISSLKENNLDFTMPLIKS